MGAYEWITGALPKRSLDNGALLVSGAYPRKGPKAKQVEQFAFEFGKRVAEREASIVSGNGPTVGNSLVNGIYSVKMGEVFQYCTIIPFKQHGTVEDMTHAQKSQYFYQVRQELISKANIIVIISGEKLGKDGQIINSDTVMTEYSAGLDAGRFCIPVAVLGGAAAIIHQKIQEDIKKKLHVYKDLPSGLFNNLADTELSSGEIIDSIFAIVDWVVERKLTSLRRSSMSRSTSVSSINSSIAGLSTNPRMNPRSPSSAAVSRQASYASTSEATLV